MPEIARALQTHQFPVAEHLAAAALQQSPRDPRLWTLQAIAYASLGRQAQALQSYHHALRLAPEYLPALQGAAQLEYATRNPAAENLLLRVLKLRPQDQVTHAMLGAIAFRKGDCPAAVEHFDQAQQVVGAQPEALTELSSCLVKLSRFDEAAVVFERLLEFNPQSSAARYNLALADWRAGHFPDAQRVLEPALEGDHPAEDDLTLGAQIAEAQGNTERALELLRRAILLEPRDKDAYLDFANLAYQHASIQVGLDIVNLGLKQLPDEAELYFARGVLLCQIGKVEQAFADFNKANQLDPKLSFVGVAQGIAQSQSHNSAAALAKLREQVKLHPDDAFASYLLAEALSEEGKPAGTPEYREEIEAAHRAVHLDPKRIEAHDLLASIYLQSGDTKDAIDESQAALAINPKDAQALYHLVLAVRKTDRKDELPGLLKRLMEARKEAETEAEQHRPHKLVESPATGSAGPA